MVFKLVCLHQYHKGKQRAIVVCGGVVVSPVCRVPPKTPVVAPNRAQHSAVCAPAFPLHTPLAPFHLEEHRPASLWHFWLPVSLRLLLLGESRATQTQALWSDSRSDDRGGCRVSDKWGERAARRCRADRAGRSGRARAFITLLGSAHNVKLRSCLLLEFSV